MVFFSPSCCSNRESYQTGLHFCFCFRMIAPRQKGLLLKNCTERSHRECNEFSFPHKNWRVTLTHQVKNKNENSFSLFCFSWDLSASTGHTQSMQHHSFQAIQYSGAMRDVGEKNTHDKRNAFFSSFLFPFSCNSKACLMGFKYQTSSLAHTPQAPPTLLLTYMKRIKESLVKHRNVVSSEN